MITTANFNDLVKNARVQWQEGRDEFPSVRSELAQIVTVGEEDSSHSSLSQLPTARRRDEGDDAYKGTPKQGYTKTLTQAEIALGVDVTKKMRMFDKYGQIMKRMRAMGKSAERRFELDLAMLLSYAWATTYSNIDGETITVSTPDGLALIDEAHTPNGSSSTFSNEISTTHDAISPDTLEALEEKFNDFLDDDGRNIPVIPDTIVSGRHAPTRHTIKRILESEKLQGTTDNDKNTFKGDYKHLVVPFLDMDSDETRNSDKSKYVFVAALQGMENGLLIEQSQGVNFEAPEQVFESGTWQFQTNALYDLGTLYAAFIAGTKGTGVAV